MAHYEQKALEHKQFVDYKDVQYLRQFTTPHAKIMGRKRTGMPAAKQRQITLAIKRSRYMALMPFVAA